MSKPDVASERAMPETGALVQYARFVDVQQRRARITAELAASFEGVTYGRHARSDDRVFGGDDSQPGRTEPRS
jgi:hypothetical protein